MKKGKKALTLLLIFTLALSLFPQSAQAAKKKKVKLSKKTVTVKIGKTVKLKLKNNKKKVKWTVISGKKNVTLSKKKKTGVTIKGKKPGTAKGMFFFGAVSSIFVGGNDIFEVMVRLNLFYLAVLVLGLNIWTTNDNALYTAGLGLANIFHQRKKPMVLLSGIIGTVASVWLYYNFCGWLNILNCTLPPVGMILVLAYFMNKEDFEADQPKLKTVDWFAVAGVILGAIVANLLHWGIASINGMAVAAVCYCVGQAVNKRK